MYGIHTPLVWELGILSHRTLPSLRDAAEHFYQTGVNYLWGRDDCFIDKQKAVLSFSKATEQRHALGSTYLGWCSIYGIGTPKNIPLGTQLLNQAFPQVQILAQDGNADAQYCLGWMHESGLNGLEKSDSEAFMWYQESANQFHSEGLRSLGWLYAKGYGEFGNQRERDMEAIKFFKQASEQNHAAAQINLAWMHQHRRDGFDDPKRSDAEAVKWLTRAAKKNHTAAQNNLSIMYTENRCGLNDPTRNKAEAVKWLIKAAEQKDANAQHNLRIIFPEFFDQTLLLLTEKNSDISVLDFKNCGITDADISRLVNVLHKNKSVRTIDVRNNRITIKGAKMLIHLSRTNKAIQHINFNIIQRVNSTMKLEFFVDCPTLLDKPYSFVIGMKYDQNSKTIMRDIMDSMHYKANDYIYTQSSHKKHHYFYTKQLLVNDIKVERKDDRSSRSIVWFGQEHHAFLTYITGQLIQQIADKTPNDFENLVTDLLNKVELWLDDDGRHQIYKILQSQKDYPELVNNFKGYQLISLEKSLLVHGFTRKHETRNFYLPDDIKAIIQKRI